MVEKNRRKIAKKPQTKSNPDNWVSGGEIDPEIKSPGSDIPTTVEDKNEKTYPHRISFDLDTAQYKKIKWASFDSNRPMNEILREALEEWLKSRNY